MYVCIYIYIYIYIYMPSDCWFYVIVLMFNIEKKNK